MTKIKRNQVMREVMVQLTHEERAQMQSRVNDLYWAVQEDVEQFDLVKKTWKGKIEEKQREMFELNQALRDGKILKEVLCDINLDFTANRVEYTHEGEVVERRAMSAEERQVEM